MDAVEFTEIMLHGTLMAPLHDKLFSPPLEDGYLKVPRGPGFGVELDEEKVRRFISDIKI